MNALLSFFPPSRLRRLALFAAAIVLTAASIFFTGCAGMSSGAEEKGQYTMIINDRVPLNQEGPMQTSPPEIYLDAGVRVRLVQDAGTYARVETVRGQSGWVPRSALTVNNGL